jgi:hypothetical protein
MNSSLVEIDTALASRVTVTKDSLAVELVDGRTVTVPVVWYPRLSHATTKERNGWTLIAGGRGIHWPNIDEDVSLSNLLLGRRSGESQQSFKQWLARRNNRKGRSKRAEV